MWSKLFPLVLIPGFALCGLLVRFHDARIEEVRAQFTTEEMQAAKESIALSLMGQIQFTAHSLIWMKTLEYLHYGVALRMPTAAEERQGLHAHEATDVATGLSHKCGVPVALAEKVDWRGPVGKLHRTITPHMEIHRHSAPTELIPWYQLTLKLNPNIERLYSLEAFFLADFANEPQQAYELLEAGVEANPWTFEIRAALGRHIFDYHEQLGIPPEKAYEQAAQILQEAVDHGKEEKARLENTDSQFDEYQEQLFAESYLFLAKSLTELGQYEDALALCEEGFKATGHNLLKVQKRVTKKRMNKENATAWN
ncbi:MAG: hypothetical protein R6V12_04465 [Candidatus Hydrogenedentota bacterium]